MDHLTETQLPTWSSEQPSRLNLIGLIDKPAVVSRVADSAPSWDERTLPLPDLFKQFDMKSEPVLAGDLKGRLHLAITANNGNSLDGKPGGLFVLTSRSGDKWDRVIHVFNNNVNATAGGVSIACDNTEMIGPNKNPFRNHLYVAWTVDSTASASSSFSEILFAKSVDGGNTFLVPIAGGWTYAPMRLDTAGGIVSNPNVSIDEQGVVTVSWTETDRHDGSTKLVSRNSANGGLSFGGYD